MKNEVDVVMTDELMTKVDEKVERNPWLNLLKLSIFSS